MTCLHHFVAHARLALVYCEHCGEPRNLAWPTAVPKPKPARKTNERPAQPELPLEPGPATEEAQIAMLREIVSGMREGKFPVDEPMPDANGFDPFRDLEPDRPRQHTEPEFDDTLPEPGL